MKLFDYLASDDSKILLVNAFQSLTLAQLKQIQTGYVQLLSDVQGKPVCVDITSHFTLALWLLLLDGVVERLTILPPDITDQQRAEFIAQTDSILLLTDREAIDANCDVIYLSELQPLLELNSSKVSLNNNVQTQWVLATSGTTATPKLVVHTLASLAHQVKRPKGDLQHVWGLLYGLHRFAGLQVFLQTVMAGNTLVLMEKGQALSDVLLLFADNAVSCLSATPTLWRKILMLPHCDSLDLKAITLGGEIADKQILSGLAAQYPMSKIRHIYASTEAGVGFSVSDGLAGFPSYYIEQGIGQVYLKISQESTLLIKSPACAQRYLNQYDLTLVDGYVDTGDVIRFSQGRWYFEGRANGTINVGGNKVQPETVEQVLRAYPGVLLAYVFAKKSSVIGQLVQATLVLDDSVTNKKNHVQALRQYCKLHLKPYQVPALIKVVDDLPLNENGKVCRNE